MNISEEILEILKNFKKWQCWKNIFQRDEPIKLSSFVTTQQSYTMDEIDPAKTLRMRVGSYYLYYGWFQFTFQATRSEHFLHD